MQIVNYDKIYSQYNENLLNKLRGFSNKELYLGDWIPSENINDSLIDLIKIFYNKEKNTKIKIIFFEKKNFKSVLEFYNTIQNQCNVKIEKGLSLSLIISDITADFFSLFKKEKYIKKNITKIKHSISKKKIDFLKNIIQKNKKFKFEINKEKYDYLKKKNIYFENKDYALILNLNKNIIININFFVKKKLFLNKFLLENICYYSLDRNIDFFKNDLLNVLEFNLRNSSFKKNVKGIISVYVLTNKLIEFKNTILKICNKLKIDNLRDKVEKQNQIYLNKKLIEEKTQIFNRENNITVEVMEINNYFIKIDILNNKKKFIPKIIFEYDKYLKETINSKIDVYYTEKKDLNKLRIKNLKQ